MDVLANYCIAVTLREVAEARSIISLAQTCKKLWHVYYNAICKKIHRYSSFNDLKCLKCSSQIKLVNYEVSYDSSDENDTFVGEGIDYCYSTNNSKQYDILSARCTSCSSLYALCGHCAYQDKDIEPLELSYDDVMSFNKYNLCKIVGYEFDQFRPNRDINDFRIIYDMYHEGFSLIVAPGELRWSTLKTESSNVIIDNNITIYNNSTAADLEPIALDFHADLKKYPDEHLFVIMNYLGDLDRFYVDHTYYITGPDGGHSVYWKCSFCNIVVQCNDK